MMRQSSVNINVRSGLCPVRSEYHQGQLFHSLWTIWSMALTTCTVGKLSLYLWNFSCCIWYLLLFALLLQILRRIWIHLPIAALQVVEDSSQICPQPSLLHNEQTTSLQPVLKCQVPQFPNHVVAFSQACCSVLFLVHGVQEWTQFSQ